MQYNHVAKNLFFFFGGGGGISREKDGPDNQPSMARISVSKCSISKLKKKIVSTNVKNMKPVHIAQVS